MDILPICISVYHMSVSIQKRASDSLKLELQMAVSYYIDVKNWIHVLWKNSTLNHELFLQVPWSFLVSAISSLLLYQRTELKTVFYKAIEYGPKTKLEFFP